MMISVYSIQVLSLIAVYWVLISGLTVLVGYAGQLSIGHVGLLAIGSYTYTVLTGTFGFDPYLATLAGGVLCALFGFALGLPSMRLPEFYFAMVTMAFGLIVAELALAEAWLTGGGVGMPALGFPAPFDTPLGFMVACLLVAAVTTWLVRNLCRTMRGRAAVAIRESAVAAASVGIPVERIKLLIFVFSGFTAGIAGALFAVSQDYITPEAFSIDLSLYFFVAIIVGGRANLIGPFLGTIFLAILPQLVGGWARYSTIIYGVILLLVVLMLPSGVGSLLRDIIAARRKAGQASLHPEMPDLTALRAAIPPESSATARLQASDVSKRFQGVLAVDAVSLDLRGGEIHGLIGPNGSGKTTLLNLLSGYYAVDSGVVTLGDAVITKADVQARAHAGVARTFQTPKLLRLLTVLDNAMLGCWPRMRSSFVGALLRLPNVAREEAAFRQEATAMLAALGLTPMQAVRADLLEHGAQRLLEIGRALLTRPRFLLLDEPASGLTFGEIDILETILRAACHSGIGILLVEHHTDFVFRICDRVTALNLGKIIAQGTPREVSASRELMRVYLGGESAAPTPTPHPARSAVA